MMECADFEKRADKMKQHEDAVAEKARTGSTMSAGPARPLNQAQRAIQEFDEAPEIKADVQAEIQAPVTDAIGLLIKNAEILIEADESRLALNLLRNVLMRQPEHPLGLQRMGRCLRDEGRFDEALKCFRALAKVQTRGVSGGLDARILIAETLYLDERDENALAVYRDILKNPIDDQRALFEIYKNIGNIHVRLGDYDSAEEFYNKAFTLQPDSDTLMVNYGTLEIQRDAINQAVQRFRRAVEVNPENDKGWVGLALVHRKMGDFELAWANLLRALDIKRTNRTAIRLVVEWASVDQRFSVATDRLQEYLETDGEDAEMSFTLAKIFAHTGRLREARIEMERVLALDTAIEGGEALKFALDRELAAKERSSSEMESL